MTKYRKKPVVIEAILLNEDKSNIIEVLNFLSGQNNTFSTVDPHLVRDSLKCGGVLIETLEGTMLATFGDYVIKGISNEFYPCKPDIFAKTYELAD